MIQNGMWVIKHISGKLPVYTFLVDADLKAKGIDCKSATLDEIKGSEKSATECQMVMGNILFPIENVLVNSLRILKINIPKG